MADEQGEQSKDSRRRMIDRLRAEADRLEAQERDEAEQEAQRRRAALRIIKGGLAPVTVLVAWLGDMAREYRWRLATVLGTAAAITGAIVGMLTIPGDGEESRTPSISSPTASVTPTPSAERTSKRTPQPSPTPNETPLTQATATQTGQPDGQPTATETTVRRTPTPVPSVPEARESAPTVRPSPPRDKKPPARPPAQPPGDEDNRPTPPPHHEHTHLLCARADLDPLARLGVCVG